MSSVSTIAIIVAVIGLMYLAYKGWSIILIAPILAVVVAIGCGSPFFDILENIYLAKAAEYIRIIFRSFFSVLCLQN